MKDEDNIEKYILRVIRMTNFVTCKDRLEINREVIL